MLNLNSLKVIDVDVFLLVSYYFVFFNYSMISFFLPSVVPRKRVQKYYLYPYPPNFLMRIFQKFFTFSVTCIFSTNYFYAKKHTFFLN